MRTIEWRVCPFPGAQDAREFKLLTRTRGADSPETNMGPHLSDYRLGGTIII